MDKARGFKAGLALLVAALTACGGGSEGSSKTGGPAAGTALGDVCGTLDKFLTTDGVFKVSGYSFVMFQPSADLLTCAGGDQDLQTVVPIASASKLASAAAIMTLVDSGQLDLDTPVSLYLLASGVQWPLNKLRITMRMLLSHTSGLPGLNDETSPECINQETGMTLQECVQQIADTELVTTPGQVFNYGGASYQVAGFIAATIANKSWEAFFQDAIAKPVGLTRFSYGDPATITNPRIAGGAATNAVDYAKFLQMILNGGSANGDAVLSADAIAEMETDQIEGKEKQFVPVDPEKFPGYTLGFFISAPGLHPGSDGPEFSDPGLFGTTPWIDLDLNYGAVIVINKGTATGITMWNAVRPQIISSLASGT